MNDGVLRTTETGYLRTVLYREADGSVTLRRVPGVDRETRSTPEVRHNITGVEVSGVRWAVGVENETGEYEYRVPGPANLAMSVSSGAASLSTMTRVLADVARAMSAVHANASYEPCSGATPLGCNRLSRWLRDGAGPRAATRTYAALGRHLGTQGMDQLRSWTAEAVGCSEVVVLGAPGLGSVYLGTATTPTTVLVTDEVGVGPRTWDLGWLAGELLERRVASGADTAPAENAILSAYGRCDRAQVGRFALLRWVLHLHDYSAYVGWDDDIDRRLKLIGGLLTG